MMVRTLIAIILCVVTFLRSEHGYRIPFFPPYDLYGIVYGLDDYGFLYEERFLVLRAKIFSSHQTIESSL